MNIIVLGDEPMDTQEYMQALLSSNLLRESTMKVMINALDLTAGSNGLDAGCGVGLQCLLLVEAVGPTGHVTGLDVSNDFLQKGREIAGEAGLSDQITFKEGDVADLPFEDDSFDWLWSSDCVGYGPWEQVPLLEEMVRVVKPNGIVALAGWSSEKLLPGYPELEAKLGTTSVGLAPFVPGSDPENHFLRALGWFRKLGFKEPKAQAFAGSICAPSSDNMRDALIDIFESRWYHVKDELELEDKAEYERLCNPDSPDFILDHPDYYGFFTYSLFWGRVPL